MVIFVSGLPPLSLYVVAVDERSDEPIVCRIMLKAAPEVVIREVSSASSFELERELNVLTVASVTAAPKPVIVCLYPDVESSMLSCHVFALLLGEPLPRTGATIDVSFLERSEVVQKAVAPLCLVLVEGSDVVGLTRSNIRRASRLHKLVPVISA